MTAQLKDGTMLTEEQVFELTSEQRKMLKDQLPMEQKRNTRYGTCRYCGCGLKSPKALSCQACYIAHSVGKKKMNKKVPDYRLMMKDDPSSMMVDKECKRRLPPMVTRIYGCINCEWKGKDLCPFGFKKGTGHFSSANMHTNGICSPRKAYLLSMTPASVHNNSFSTWQLSFNKCMAQMQNMQGYQKLLDKEKELEDAAERGVPKKELAELQAKRDRLRAEWFEIWQELCRLDDRQVDRETPKKLDVTQKNLSLSDIHKLMSDKPFERKAEEEPIEVEAEFEEEEDKEDDKRE